MPSLRRLVRATDWETVRAKLKAGEAGTKRGKTLGKPGQNKTLGKPWQKTWENSGETMAKYAETLGRAETEIEETMGNKSVHGGF